MANRNYLLMLRVNLFRISSSRSQIDRKISWTKMRTLITKISTMMTTTIWTDLQLVMYVYDAYSSASSNRFLNCAYEEPNWISTYFD
jgi:hypothetical protein